LASIDPPVSPALAGTPYSAQSPASPSHIRELAVKPPHLQAALVGASLAAALALVVVVVRARSRRRARAADTGSGVFGTILKSSLFAAAQTVVKLGATRLAAKATHHDDHSTPLEAASE
jgi:hypothetical protein